MNAATVNLDSAACKKAFLAALPRKRALGLQAVDGLGETLAGICRETAEWRAHLEVSSEMFLRYLAEHTPEEGFDIASLHHSDLALACACASAKPPALAEFERYTEDAWRQALSKVQVSTTVAADVRQALRTRLFVGSQTARDPGEAHIRRYSGRGDLRAWYRTTAIRALLDAVRASKRESSSSERELGERVAMVDLELDYLKKNYRAEFRESFHDALRTLAADERNLLRYQLLDQLTLEQIGRIYGVHLSSIARRLQKVRTQLLEETRAGLSLRLGVDDGELDSIMRLIGSRLEVSLSAVLGAGAKDA